MTATPGYRYDVVMDSTDTLIVGAGISGLALAAELERDYVVLEADIQIGGYCKTTRQDGFVWDYSGHFFHFRHPEIAHWFRSRMTHQRVFDVQKRSFIWGRGFRVDFPFQKNIHQLPQADFIRCLHDLYFAQESRAEERTESETFQEMLYARYGRGISDMFLIPYNEKLYACDLRMLDRDAMGRFFPHVSLADVIRNMRCPDNHSYNSTFTYPEGGAFEYVKALANEVPTEAICIQERLLEVDTSRRIATTDRRRIRYQTLVSTMPFNRLLNAAGIPSPAGTWTWNKVVVYNLGFDRKAARDVHWIYFPDPETIFYRVGYYDNILDGDRLSLYVEIGFQPGAQPDARALLQRVLADLRREGIIDEHRLVASQCLTLDPAYVHITRASMTAHAELSDSLRHQGIYSIGRYGSWTYCSIEDNVVQARALATMLKEATPDK